jgi:TRAP-type C4-dicarboxylate transport system permease small subunit
VGQRAHLALELLPEKLEGESLRRLQRLILGCVAVFALFVMVGGGIRLVYLQFMLGQTSPTLGWPLGAVYAVVPLSGLIMLTYTALQIIEPPAESEIASKPRDAGSA